MTNMTIGILFILLIVMFTWLGLQNVALKWKMEDIEKKVSELLEEKEN